jgi:tetratricopeptide (TPR) repeat protein
MARKGKIRGFAGMCASAVLAVCTTLCVSDGALAKQAAKPPLIWIRAGDHKGLTRLLVSWHAPVTYKIDEAPGAITVTFDHPARPDLGDTATKTFKDIKSVAADNDSGNLIVHLTVKPGSHPRAFKAGNMVIVDILDPVDPTPAAAPSPVAGEQASATPPASPPPSTAVTKSDLPQADETVIHISPVEPVNLAAFRRGPYLWIAASGKLPATAPTVSGLEPIAEPSRYTAQSGDLLRYAVKDGDLVTVRQKSGGWDVVLSDKPASEKGLLVTGSNVSDTLKILAPGAVKVLMLTDPEMGDTLQIVPLPSAGAFVARARHFGGGELMQTGEGVAAVLRNPVADLKVADGAVLIKGLNLSADLASAGIEHASLFDFPAWRAGGLTGIMARRREIEHASLVNDGLGEQKMAVDLARLYIANGFGNEALGTLRIAIEAEPDLATSPDFFALRGAANALAGRRQDAMTDFDAASLHDHPEAALWRAFAEADGTAEQKQEAFTILQSDADIISKYPPELRKRFELALSALAVEKRDQPGLQTSLNLLMKEPPDPAFSPALIAVKAGVAAGAGKPDVSEKYYAQLAAWPDDYWRALGMFASIGDGLEHKTMTPKDAIPKLESLRYEWRGDDLELKTLRELGDLYLGEQDYKDALDILTQLHDLAPDTPYAIAARDNIVDAARHAFTLDQSATLPPLEALDLFNSLQDVLPPHTVPDADIRNLSDRLASSGIMDRAAALLEPLMKDANDPAAKAQLGARIAALRLLDDHPELALTTLASSEPAASAKLPDDLATARKLLQARALSKTGKPDAAIAELQGVTTREADALRVEIFWGQHDWPNAALALNHLAAPPPAGGKMTAEQASIVLNEAVAYSLAQDQLSIDKLRSTYLDAMNKTDKANAFNLLTSSGADMRAPSVDAIRASVSNLDIFDHFLSSYRKAPGKA